MLNCLDNIQLKICQMFKDKVYKVIDKCLLVYNTYKIRKDFLVYLQAIS